jgi:glycosyltransferase involved in cell wall biosynthesis
VLVEYVSAGSISRFTRLAGRGQYLHYLSWIWAAARRCQQLAREREFDLAHHVTYAIDWLPSPLAYVDGLSYIWGPVGGSTYPPARLLGGYNPREAAREMLRVASSSVLRATVTRPTIRRARLVLALNRDSERTLHRARQVEVRPNAALDRASLASIRDSKGTSGPHRRAAYLGRAIASKGLGLALNALAHTNEWELVVMGGGDLDRWLRRANRLGIEERVTFLGHLSRPAALQMLSSCDVLLHPSLHDSAPWSVAEAALLGLPVICLDMGGGPLLAGRLGIVIKPDRQAVARIAAALEALPEASRIERPDWSLERLHKDLASWYGVPS